MFLYFYIIFIFNNNTDFLTVVSSNLGLALVEVVCLLWFVIVCKLKVLCLCYQLLYSGVVSTARRRGASSGASESGWMKERWPASGAAAAAGLYAVRISRVNSPLMYLRLGLYRPHVRAGGGAPPPAPPPPVHSYIRSSCARPVVVVDVVRALMFVVQLIWLLCCCDCDVYTLMWGMVICAQMERQLKPALSLPWSSAAREHKKAKPVVVSSRLFLLF